MSRKLISSDEAKPAKRQHTQPCSDCPFRRDALPGWLGGKQPQHFIDMAQGEVAYPCHVKRGQQCAGMAIFRSNIIKSPRNKEALVLPKNKIKVFSWPTEFVEYHSKKESR